MYRIIGISLAAMALLAILATSARGQVINENLKLLANDGGVDNQFGYSIAIDQGIIAVGARSDDDNGTNSGSVYLFDASTGTQVAKLLPSDGAVGDEFGFSIAINDGIVAVGAPRDDDNGDTSGSAYLFDASTGAELAKLTPEDGAAGDEFGNSIAIDDGIVAIGAWRDDEYGDGSGAAYLFDASTGDQLDKLLPNTGNRYQTFGVSIAMDDGIVVIGSRTYFVLGEGYTFAKAYLFDVSTGDQINVLQADIENYNGDLGGRFGDAVDIDNGIIAVGAWGRSIFFDHSGAAYLFDAATGSQLAFIFPSDGHDRDHFGNSISIDNGVVAIGAHQDGDNGWVAGSAYLYDALTGTQIDKLLASDGAQFDYFSSSIAIDNGVVAVGAIGDEDNGSDSGAAYIFGGISFEVPDSFLITRGTYASGGVVELTESDNADLSLRRTTTDTQSRTEFEVRAVSPVAVPSSLEVMLEGSVFARSQVDQSIELYDYGAATWEQVDLRVATHFTDSTVSVAASGDLSRFVEAGTMCMQARIRYQSTSPRQRFSSNTDHFMWAIGH